MTVFEFDEPVLVDGSELEAKLAGVQGIKTLGQNYIVNGQVPYDAIDAVISAINQVISGGHVFSFDVLMNRVGNPSSITESIRVLNQETQKSHHMKVTIERKEGSSHDEARVYWRMNETDYLAVTFPKVPATVSNS